MRSEANSLATITSSLSDLKEALILRLQRCEHTLIQIDCKMLFERKCLVELLSYVGDGIESREAIIKAQLA